MDGFRRFTGLAAAWVAAASLAQAQALDTMTVHLIDVGQGAATLLEFPCGAALIDTGGENVGVFKTNEHLLPYLNDFFARRTDLHRTLALVVLSHPHPDHYAGVSVLLDPANGFTIGNVVDNAQKILGSSPQVRLRKWAKKNAHYEGIRTRKVTGTSGKTDGIIDPINCAPVDPVIRVLWGSRVTKPAKWTTKQFDQENNHSVLVRVDFGMASFLFTGDLEEAGEGDVVKKYAGTSTLDVDVFQAAHHGASNGSGGGILDLVTPQIVLIPMGDPSRTDIPDGMTAFRHGHPRRDTVNRFLARVVRQRAVAKQVLVADGMHSFSAIAMPAEIYGTGWDGAVQVIAKTDGTYQVFTER